ncbi:MAG: hypothetical protein U0528_04885 [Anaerolineae bacterium]
MTNEPQETSSGVYVDSAQTYRLTFISLAIGLIIAIPIGLLLLSLRQPLTTDSSTGSVQFSLGALMLPAAALSVVLILAWAVFRLPVRLAQRQNIILDPEVWPWTGAVSLGILVVVGFVAAIFFGLI